MQRGERFWPDSIFKDLIVSLAIFVLLVLLATFVGVENSPKADPSDTSYIPRPEWYFLFLFKFLALYGQIPVLGKIEWLATVLVPAIGIGLLTLLPFIDRSPARYYTRRMLPLTVMGLVVLDIVLLTLMADIPTVSESGSRLSGLLQAIAGTGHPRHRHPAADRAGLAAEEEPAAPDGLDRGHCRPADDRLHRRGACHRPRQSRRRRPRWPAPSPSRSSPDRTSTPSTAWSATATTARSPRSTGVEGLEGKEISAINGHDVLYTLNDASLAEVIDYGRPDAGMNPFGKAYNAEGLSKSEIDYIVTFMRYFWDDRFEPPAEALKPLFPALAANEVPSYEVHIAPIVKRYCMSCHRAGKKNNNFLMTSYQEMLTTGDNKENDIIAGDPNSYLLQIIQGHEILDEKGEVMIHVMPLKSTLKPNVIDVWIRWIMNGMPETAAQAFTITPIAPPTPTATP